MKKNIIKVDLSPLSSKVQNLFLNFCKLHPNQNITQLVEVWNKYTKSVNEYVFLEDS